MTESSLLEQVSSDLENRDFNSLIDNPTSYSDVQEESLISSDDTMSFAELNNDLMSEHEIELRRKFFSNPKNQATILLNNYVREQSILINRSQRKKIYADFLRNAKKGKYNKIFSDYINGVSKEESQKKFSKLNG